MYAILKNGYACGVTAVYACAGQVKGAFRVSSKWMNKLAGSGFMTERRNI